jgi:hypothetical protein
LSWSYFVNVLFQPLCISIFRDQLDAQDRSGCLGLSLQLKEVVTAWPGFRLLRVRHAENWRHTFK